MVDIDFTSILILLECYHQSVWPWKTLKTVDIFLSFFKEGKKEQKDKTSTFLKMRYCMFCWARGAGSMCLDFVTNKPRHKHVCEKTHSQRCSLKLESGHVFLYLSDRRHVMRRTEGVSLTLVILGKLHSERLRLWPAQFSQNRTWHSGEPGAVEGDDALYPFMEKRNILFVFQCQKYFFVCCIMYRHIFSIFSH